MTGGFRFASVSAGFSHTCGVTTSGAVFCWGSNFNGELGNTSVEINSNTDIPVAVSGGLVLRQIVAATEKTYYGRVRTIGLAVYRTRSGWELGCSLPLGRVNQATSRTVLETLCPSVVWRA